MIRLAARSLVSHRRRVIGAALAVVIAVGFLGGTLILGDMTRKGFDSVFVAANEGVDAVVRSKTRIGTELAEQRGLIDPSLVESIRQVDGVATAEAVIDGFGQIIGADGEPVGTVGPPTLAGSWIEHAAVNPYRLLTGRGPEQPGEVVIDKGSADQGDLDVGSRIVVLTPLPVDVTVVGIVRFGNVDSLGTYVGFTFADAARYLLARPGGATSIRVAAVPGLDEQGLVERIGPVLPAAVEALTGAELTEENNQDIEDDILAILDSFLLVFALIALLVATFSIYNTFSIIIAQRTTEAALLRAVGASRRQIVALVTLEALAIGITASLLGLAAGAGLAIGTLALIRAAGFALPDPGLAIDASTVIVVMAVGVLVTLAASTLPALRAARIPPIAALRHLAIEQPATSRARTAAGLIAAAAGAALVIVGAKSEKDGLTTVGFGGLLSVAGAVLLGPVIARPLANMLGSAVTRLRGVAGALARTNATRNPRRTAATAAALTMGIGIVVLFTVLVASLKAGVEEDTDASFTGDIVIAGSVISGAGLSPELTSALKSLPETQVAVGVTVGTVILNGDEQQITATDPTSIARVVDLDVVAGSLTDLGDRQLAVSSSFADDRAVAPAGQIVVRFADGVEATFTVGAIFDKRLLLGDVIMPSTAWEPHAVQLFDTQVLIALNDGIDPTAGRQAVEAVADRYHAPDVFDPDEYIEWSVGFINQVLAIVYALLVLAIVIASMGIANTMALAIHERTRELGLLRAVGQTRSQMRAMIRWESAIIAAIGTTTGIALGLFIGWGIVRSVGAAEDLPAPFTVPIATVLMIAVVGTLIGIIAGIRPARRAAKLDILRAIATT